MPQLEYAPDPEVLAKVLELQDVDEKKRRTRKIPTDRDFAKFVNGQRARIEELTSSLAKGNLTNREYIEALFSLLEGGHAESAFMGRQISGDLSPMDDDDFGFAELVMNGESEFLARFLSDLDGGRYYDAEQRAFKEAQINQRAKMYTGKFRGTANETFVLSSEIEDEFNWHQLTIEPCEDCPRLESGSPYVASQLRQFPGDGKTSCKTRCGCVLVRIRDGRFGFSRSYE